MSKLKTITQEMKEYYITNYLKTYSISQIMRESVYEGIGRERIKKILMDAGVYEGINGPNYLKHKVKKQEKLLMEKYGVINWGQTKDGGYKKQNKIPYKKISFLSEEFQEYKEKVNKKTRSNLKKVTIPKYCYYTGILFADEEYEPNPNDPRKRSIDHRTPIIICYLNGDSVEKASCIDNIAYVLKYVNSIKQNTMEENFIHIAKKIRKVFIDEGYKSN